MKTINRSRLASLMVRERKSLSMSAEVEGLVRSHAQVAVGGRPDELDGEVGGS